MPFLPLSESILHDCGGAIYLVADGPNSRLLCVGCAAFTRDCVNGRIPAGTNKERNEAAWDAGKPSSPDDDDDPGYVDVPGQPTPTGDTWETDPLPNDHGTFPDLLPDGPARYADFAAIDEYLGAGTIDEHGRLTVAGLEAFRAQARRKLADIHDDAMRASGLEYIGDYDEKPVDMGAARAIGVRFARDPLTAVSFLTATVAPWATDESTIAGPWDGVEADVLAALDKAGCDDEDGYEEAKEAFVAELRRIDSELSKVLKGGSVSAPEEIPTKDEAARLTPPPDLLQALDWACQHGDEHPVTSMGLRNRLLDAWWAFKEAKDSDEDVTWLALQAGVRSGEPMEVALGSLGLLNGEGGDPDVSGDYWQLDDDQLNVVAECLKAHLSLLAGSEVATIRQAMCRGYESAWSNYRALAVVVTEQIGAGLQDYPNWIEEWRAAGDALSERIGHKVYWESINGAVAGLYNVPTL